MGSRLKLQSELEKILGSRNVYFQPPSSLKIKYPAIVYSRNSIDNNFANNSVYKQDMSYMLTVIYTDPDSEIPINISKMKKCRFDRHYTADNLNHDVFTLYY